MRSCRQTELPVSQLSDEVYHDNDSVPAEGVFGHHWCRDLLGSCGVSGTSCTASACSAIGTVTKGVPAAGHEDATRQSARLSHIARILDGASTTMTLLLALISTCNKEHCRSISSGGSNSSDRNASGCSLDGRRLVVLVGEGRAVVGGSAGRCGAATTSSGHGGRACSRTCHNRESGVDVADQGIDARVWILVQLGCRSVDVE